MSCPGQAPHPAADSGDAEDGSIWAVAMKSRRQALRFSPKSIPIALAAVSLVAYGLLLPTTGFYWDDWPFAWIARFLGPSEFIPAFEGFRPLLGPIFYATTNLIPPNPLLWQILALVVHALAAISVWIVLDTVWPQFRLQTLGASLLFLVFPGYSQHWVALTHINQEWISLIAYMFSIALSLQALRERNRRVRAMLAAALLQIVGLFPTEYFIGLEPVRFLLLWVVAGQLQGGFRLGVWRAVRHWLPYLAMWLLDVAWLAVYYGSGIYISYDLTAASNPPAFGQALFIFADAIWKAGLFVWVQILPLLWQSLATPTSLMTIGLVVFSFVATASYLHRLDLPHDTEISVPTRSPWRAFAFPALLIGVIGIVLGRVPSFVAALPLTLQSSFDRFMISMMFGGSLVAMALIEMISRDRRLRVALLAAVIALGMGQQFFNANIFRRDWQRQREIYWQMAWRIPALQPGTAILTQQMPLDYETDLSMTAAVNWMYARQVTPPVLPYAMLYTEKRLGGTALPSLAEGTAIKLPFRTMQFAGSTSRALAIYVPANACLRVFDPNDGDAETYSRLPEAITATIPISHPSLIDPNAAPNQLSNPPFGGEPAHTWCYYYERADLARQRGDWSGVVDLAELAAKAGFEPTDSFEWLPFIEAYARTGRLGAAAQLTRKSWQAEPKLRRGLCVLWHRIHALGEGSTQSLALELLADFGCAP
jgi:hypothetical protein